MGSRGFGADIRRLLLRGNVFALAIAVLMGTALFQLLYAAVGYVAIPFARGVLKEQHEAGAMSSYSLYSNFHGYLLYWGEAVTLMATLGLAALLVIALRKRLTYPDDEEEEEIDIEEEDLRACPECLSLIPAAAHRCAFCTAPVEPAQPPTGELA